MNVSEFFKDNGLELDWKKISSIPGMDELCLCEQNPKWHAEGSAWEHTKNCVEVAQHFLKDMALTERDRNILIIGVLLHDIGKSKTTEFLKGKWHSYGHEIAGEKLVRGLLWSEDIETRERICNMVRWHMDVLRIADSSDFYQKILKLSLEPYFRWSDLIFVKRCDILGSKMEDASEPELSLKKLDFVSDGAATLNVMSGPNFSFNRDKIYRHKKDLFSENEDVRNVYVMIGLPGAGKDFTTKNTFDDATVLSRDDIRVELGFCTAGDKIIGNEDQERVVTELFEMQFINALKENRGDIVLNNINIKKKYRDGYKKLAGNLKVNWHYIYVEAPNILINIERRPMISQGAFVSMTENLEWPRGDEYDDFRIIKY